MRGSDHWTHTNQAFNRDRRIIIPGGNQVAPLIEAVAAEGRDLGETKRRASTDRRPRPRTLVLTSYFTPACHALASLLPTSRADGNPSRKAWSEKKRDAASRTHASCCCHCGSNQIGSCVCVCVCVFGCVSWSIAANALLVRTETTVEDTRRGHATAEHADDAHLTHAPPSESLGPVARRRRLSLGV
jgi:hypothetical protein